MITEMFIHTSVILKSSMNKGKPKSMMAYALVCRRATTLLTNSSQFEGFIYGN